MPFINVRTTCEINPDKMETIKSEFGKAITVLPGKSEHWLMVGFQDKYDLYFQGNKDADSAFVEVKIYGKASPDSYDKLTSRLTQILHSSLSIPSERIYIEYEETPYWGFDGANF